MVDLGYKDMLEHELSRIRQYAIEHNLSPNKVADYFSVGIVAARVLLPDTSIETEEVAPDTVG
jgi:hypothetical protein